MPLSTSNIIGIVTVIVSCPPLLLLIWKIIDRRHRRPDGPSSTTRELGVRREIPPGPYSLPPYPTVNHQSGLLNTSFVFQYSMTSRIQEIRVYENTFQGQIYPTEPQ
ncbi:hypothetical protein BO94DRAFT_538686 [Aspergillus sclerotioniger CBS 115572]|uniref:Uncharacterized protein n=1 Tax=Aspergillus sclerotioniger CBS 115572 TaxID=1450535 RepID=A0A317VJP4_9EURO|nr:hypothetical protein BO94DRAFT_538686 [Aspergillus sclerotioniger CBS 115572]PWY74526.1 hypothetical protein BO94DRAFT_538686 [Aspergillus sclerotioniger CBS 115572]